MSIYVFREAIFEEDVSFGNSFAVSFGPKNLQMKHLMMQVYVNQPFNEMAKVFHLAFCLVLE